MSALTEVNRLPERSRSTSCVKDAKAPSCMTLTLLLMMLSCLAVVYGTESRVGRSQSMKVKSVTMLVNWSAAGNDVTPRHVTADPSHVHPVTAVQSVLKVNTPGKHSNTNTLSNSAMMMKSDDSDVMTSRDVSHSVRKVEARKLPQMTSV